MALARVNGTEIAYDTTGAGPPLVLLHAGVGGRGLWDDGLAELAERRLVVRPDLRGFGESPLPGGPFSHVEDVRALLDHLGIARMPIVGNSLGGRVALDLALEHPERVSALVLVAAAVGGQQRTQELDAFAEEEDRLLEAGKLGEAVELNVRTWLDGPGRDAAPVPPGVRDRLASMQRLAFERLLHAYESSPAPGPVEWAEPPAATRLAGVGAPTLVVAGAHDLRTFRDVSELLAREIPGARGAVLDSAHLPGLERPHELNRLVLEFLAGLGV